MARGLGLIGEFCSLIARVIMFEHQTSITSSLYWFLSLSFGSSFCRNIEHNFMDMEDTAETTSWFSGLVFHYTAYLSEAI